MIKQHKWDKHHTTGQRRMCTTVPSNSDWQWIVELRAGWLGVPLSTVRWSCKEQLKIGLCWPVVWRLTFSGVGRMITCRHVNILCRINTKGKCKIQQRMILLWKNHKLHFNLVNCLSTALHIKSSPLQAGDVELPPKDVSTLPQGLVHLPSWGSCPFGVFWGWDLKDIATCEYFNLSLRNTPGKAAWCLWVVKLVIRRLTV